MMDGPKVDPTSDGRFGKFILHRRLGTGAMAVVYLAEMVGPSGFSKMVALKRLHPHLADNEEFIDSFISEARLGGSLEHPNIVQTIELGREQDSYYLAMELVQGTTLRKIIRASQKKWVPLPLPAALEVTRQLAIGLGYAHSATNARGQALALIHRDLKPGNVLINQFGQVKITDWGVAKSAASVRATINGNMLKGTISYMSPEQAACKDLDGRSDLYALGAILFEMVTGERLYPGDIGVQGIYRIIRGNINDRLELLKDYPQDVADIIRRLLSTDRDGRFEDAEALRAAMQPVLAKHGATQKALAAVVTGVAALKGGGTSAQIGAPLSGIRPPPNLKYPEGTNNIPSIHQNLLIDAGEQEAPSSPSGRADLTMDPRSRSGKEVPVALGPFGSRGPKGPRPSPGSLNETQPISVQQRPLSRNEPSPSNNSEVTSGRPYAFGGGPSSSLQALAQPPKRRPWAMIALPLLLIGGGAIAAGVWTYTKPTPAPLVVVRGGPQPSAQSAPPSMADISHLNPPAPLEKVPPPTQDAAPGLPKSAAPAQAPPTLEAPKATRAAPPSKAPPKPAPKAAPKPVSVAPAPQKTQAQAPPAKVASAASTKPGYLTVNARPWAWVVVDGTRLKRPTPLMREPLPSGAHSVVFETEDGRRHGPMTITVKEGESLQLKPIIFK